MIVVELDHMHREVLDELINERLAQKMDREAQLDRVKEETRHELWEESKFNHTCSFCNKTVGMERLVIGPGVSICDECTEQAVVILEGKKDQEL